MYWLCKGEVKARGGGGGLVAIQGEDFVAV